MPATGIGGRVEVQPPLGHTVTVRLGADARVVEGETRERYAFVAGTPTQQRIAGGSNVTLGGFADMSAVSGDWTLSAGGRVDHWEIRDGMLLERPLAGAGVPTRFAARSGEEFTGRAGVAWAAAEAVTVRAAGYRGWRLPTLNELYRPFRVGADLTTANAALSPERLWGVEAGVDLRPAAGLTVRGTVFWNRLDDAIANVTIASNTRQRRNLDAVEARGAELDVAWSSGAFGLSASVAYTDARVRGTALDGLRPAQTAAHQLSGTVSWRPTGGPGGSVTARYLSDPYEDDQNLRTLAGAFMIDGQVLVPVSADVSVEARAENLLDTRVEAGVSAAGVVERATPRTLWVGVRYALQLP